ncbi:molybdopterin-guanine dinucleotide biosynthesis protein B [Bacillus sp. FJAT-27225]|uniref:molybdopterin-guanine dinucleotide biosynthesis protein B n=1 Tax=Bacillus sp. FJAT-27225 TaxID=1743144 RepID=UPI00080C2F4A|nr:molybdopterin-guanine dinucleotide biosynthesis protein B [Bacillus sp. FJAT-27225]OCA84277.1 molybdopterin-guanine dinucleotide biosynthesis protein B [Bacillus sp. FJAT-27225]
MAMVRPFVFQIVGYQNSGKTTLSVGLIQILSKKGLKVATIKHHGHGGRPSVPEGKDSSRHLAAGAEASIVEGDGTLLLQAVQESWKLEQQITLLDTLGPDIILIEGHKRAGYPKIVLVRNKEDEELLSRLDGTLAVLYWETAPEKIPGVPAFWIKSEEAVEHISEIILKEAESHADF